MMTRLISILITVASFRSAFLLPISLSRLVLVISVASTLMATSAEGRETWQKAFESDVQPLLEKHCFDCHGNGANEGNLSLDQFASGEQALAAGDLWWRVLKNIRAGVMPPADHSTLSDDDFRQINDWIKFGALGIDPHVLDPGPIAVRRLNREEYGNTMRELMGVPFDEQLIFPPDDSGHGFDNVADALTVSPLLLEKYLQAAELVVQRAVPTETWIIPRLRLDGDQFRSAEGGRRQGRHLDGKRSASVAKSFRIEESGTYQVVISVKQHGSFEFDPARYVVRCSIDDQERFANEYGWDEHKLTEYEYSLDLNAGEHWVAFELAPVKRDGVDDEDLSGSNSNTNVSFEIVSVIVEGPAGTERREHPSNYRRFFPRDEPPTDAQERRSYAKEVMQAFATRAFRGRVEPATVERLVTIAEEAYEQPEVTFEAGIARAVVATLVSPRFLFRFETTVPTEEHSQFALVDELSLASRLSYLLWSSMPDDQLFALAEAGKLREQLTEQVDRMMADRKAKAFVSNFVGQWLRTRDIANVAIDAEVVLGFSEELAVMREQFRGRGRGRGRGEMSDEDRARFERFREIRTTLDGIDDGLRKAMRQETEMLVEHLVRTDASLLDLLDCNYTFLNEKLAKHYGIEGVRGEEMRRVELPADSPRGGVLTQGSMLMVTSNPTRTSPVKRGLFVLDNILGTPAPPAPAAVPELESSAERFGDREPTLRELLEVHRESDLCASCHARMDPLGLALENFNALGMWRENDGELPIDPQGQLVTGEEFKDIRELKAILRKNHARNFYRCVTEKLLVFAIGRGVEASDEHTVDLIVERLEASGGKFRELLLAIVESAPFQSQRLSISTTDAVTSNN